MLGNTICPQKSVACFDINHYRNIFLISKVANVNGGRNISCLNQYFIFNDGHQIFKFHQDVYRSPCQYHLTDIQNLTYRKY